VAFLLSIRAKNQSIDEGIHGVKAIDTNEDYKEDQDKSVGVFCHHGIWNRLMSE